MPIKHDDERVRITVAIEPDALAEYQEAASELGMSLARFVGDWLGDTKESMRMVSRKMLEVRLAPSRVLSEMDIFAEQEAAETAKLAPPRRRKTG